MRLGWCLLLLGSFLWAFPPVEVGGSVAHPEPWSVSVGTHWDAWRLRMQAGGWYSDSHTGWGVARLSVGREWLRRDWYGIETALSGGYFRAQAADSMHIAINRANGRRILYESDWEETLDAGVQLGVRLAFFHVRAGIPFYTWGNQHPRLFWQLGVHWLWGRV